MIVEYSCLVCGTPIFRESRVQQKKQCVGQKKRVFCSDKCNSNSKNISMNSRNAEMLDDPTGLLLKFERGFI